MKSVMHVTYGVQHKLRRSKIFLKGFKLYLSHFSVMELSLIRKLSMFILRNVSLELNYYSFNYQLLKNLQFSYSRTSLLGREASEKSFNSVGMAMELNHEEICCFTK